MGQTLHNDRGYTLIELIVAITLMGILGGIAATQMRGPGDFTGAYQAARLAHHLRHAQFLATHWGLRLRWSSNAGGYAVNCVNGTGALPCVNAGDTVTDPATNSLFSVVLSDGLALSAVPAASVDFDSLGRPLTTAGALMSATQRVTLTSPAGERWQVSVSPLTGYVGVAKI